MSYRETDMTHSVSRRRSVRFGAIVRRWPLLLTAMIIAISGAWWAHSRAEASYSSTMKIVVVPLPQWDETFLGTDLVRDSGDATRTAATVATELKSEHYATVAARYLGGAWTADSIAEGIGVAATGETNVIEIDARGVDPDAAQALAVGFTAAIMADRWQIIAAQLESRIAAVRAGVLAAAGDQQGVNPAGAEAAARLQTLQVVFESKSDPTLRVSPASKAVLVSHSSLAVTLVLAAIGGLFVGALAAAAIDLLSRAGNRAAQEPSSRPGATGRSPNGRAAVETQHADAKRY